MAGDLGWRGVPCVLIEKTDGRVTQPRMDMVHVRTMEFCRRWGIAPWVEAAGYNRDYPQDNAWVTSLANGYELSREPFPPPREEQPPPQSPQKRERCPQNFFDPVLARFADTFPHVTRRYHTGPGAARRPRGAARRRGSGRCGGGARYRAGADVVK